MKRFALLALLALATLVSPALAQEVAEISPDPVVTSPYQELGTLTGIVAATLVVVEILKRSLVGVPGFKLVPVWVIAVAVSTGLVALANLVLNVLPGEIGPLAWQAALLAASASGFYTWLREPADSAKQFGEDHPGAAQIRLPPSSMILLPLVGALALGGCAQTALGRYAQLQDSYIATVDVLIEARASGHIDVQTWNKNILPLIVTGDLALDQLKSAVARDADSNTISILTESVRSTLRQLAREQKTLSKKGALYEPSYAPSHSASRRIGHGPRCTFGRAYGSPTFA